MEEKAHAIAEDLNGKRILLLRGMRAEPGKSIHSEFAIYEDLLSQGNTEETVSELIFMTKNEEVLESFRPEVLLTEGTAVLSKPLKQFLRKYKPALHFHFSEQGEIADPFQTNPKLIPAALADYLEVNRIQPDKAYTKNLLEASGRCRESRNAFLAQTDWNEFVAISCCMNKLPEGATIHAANSMAVRYVAYCEPQKLGHRILSNRGTSGIDGCVSTALGYQSIDKGLNYLL